VKKTFRNPIIQAKEMQLEMEYHNLTRAQLARKLNISRARVTQMLNLLRLPDELIQEVEAMGDHWERVLLTERTLRKVVSPR
jgi:ParB-like chromosome segregation protein Spo0J